MHSNHCKQLQVKSICIARIVIKSHNALDALVLYFEKKNDFIVETKPHE